MIERWKDVENFPNYQISNTGLVKNITTERTLKPSLDSYGYQQVILSNNGVKKAHLVHRLVAKAFVDGRNDSLQINHRDGIKTNNAASNLEWVTPSENLKHAYRNGLAYRSDLAGTRPVKIRVIETGQIFYSETECANALGIKREGINACVNGRLRRYCGFSFERIT